MVLPMIAGVTQAQLFCMISSGLATIDGGTLGIFVSMGVKLKVKYLTRMSFFSIFPETKISLEKYFAGETS